MIRSTILCAGLGLSLSLGGCSGYTCESIGERVNELGKQIGENPELIFDEDIGRELEELGNKAMEMGCTG